MIRPSVNGGRGELSERVIRGRGPSASPRPSTHLSVLVVGAVIASLYELARTIGYGPESLLMLGC